MPQTNTVQFSPQDPLLFKDRVNSAYRGEQRLEYLATLDAMLAYRQQHPETTDARDILLAGENARAAEHSRLVENRPPIGEGGGAALLVDAIIHASDAVFGELPVGGETAKQARDFLLDHVFDDWIEAGKSAGTKVELWNEDIRLGTYADQTLDQALRMAATDPALAQAMDLAFPEVRQSFSDPSSQVSRSTTSRHNMAALLAKIVAKIPRTPSTDVSDWEPARPMTAAPA